MAPIANDVRSFSIRARKKVMTLTWCKNINLTKAFHLLLTSVSRTIVFVVEKVNMASKSGRN